MSYDEFCTQFTALCADYERLCVEDSQQADAARVANDLDDLMEQYPDYHARFALEQLVAMDPDTRLEYEIDAAWTDHVAAL